MMTAQDPLSSHVLQEIKTRKLLLPGEKIVLAVSGGPDSMALLHAFCTFRTALHLNLTVAHLDHCLRKGSKQDAEFVKSACRVLNVPFVSGRADVRRFARTRKLSIEDAARRLRYRFLVKAAKKAGARKIVTAHTQDDQAETVVLQLVRGAGLSGASGMDWSGPVGTGQSRAVRLVRPFLSTPRAEILKFLRRCRIRFREDPTNSSRRFKRNRLRHDVMPLLKRLNPRAVKHLATFAEILSTGKEYIDRVTEGVFTRLAHERPGRCQFQRSEFIKLPRAIQQGLFRQAVARLGGEEASLNFRHWQLFHQALYKEGVPALLHFPRSIEVGLDDRVVSFSKTRPAKKIRSVSIPKVRSGEVAFADRTITFNMFPRTRRLFPRGRAGEAWLDAERVWFPIQVRTRRPGDRFIPLGMRQSKKLQDFLVDEKVPRSERDSLPIFQDRRQIVWVGGKRLADSVKITPQTRQVLRISL
ncbi:MAG: tRNA lysidine(34) synthetase TilS [Candidatus Omnitrophica bacterium]|nr:tRNA lysidine(34) synthetase TilS [Candidatus Omnitrophota bacterium]